MNEQPMIAGVDEIPEDEDARPWNERYRMPLSQDGYSFALMKRLLRCRRNGGNIRAVLRRYGK